eukprot:COSAG01_NODE_1277_length_10932_cov_18.121942_4_plen_150_part_00
MCFIIIIIWSRYFSGDKRFIVKQITKEEHSVLLRILDDYFRHMRDSRNWRDDGSGDVRSLLLRIVQCSRVQLFQTDPKLCPALKRLLVGQLYFMVFENVFWRQLRQEMTKIEQAAQPEPEPELETQSSTENDSVQKRAENVRIVWPQSS